MTANHGERLVRRGDRFLVTRDFPTHVLIVPLAPGHTQGQATVVPADTVVVAFDQGAEAAAFVAYPEAYDDVERVLIPADRLAQPDYFAYYLSFDQREVDDLLQPLPPVTPRPTEDRLPRTAPKR